MKKPVIGITGGTGFIGSNLIPVLQNKGFDIKVLSQDSGQGIFKSVSYLKGDIAKNENLDLFLHDVDILIHLAARILPPDDLMERDNVLATSNLLKAATNHSVSHIIFTSSVAVYGKNRTGKFKESDKCNPNTAYGRSKYKAEKLLLDWSKKQKKPVTILRPFNTYGPHNKKGIIFTFYSDIKKTGKLNIYGDGKQERDFLYISDLIEVFVKIIENKKAGIFNTGAVKKYSVLDVAETFKKVLKKDIEIYFSPSEEGKVFNINQDLTKIKNELGWNATTPFKEGLAKTIKWYEENIDPNTL